MKSAGTIHLFVDLLGIFVFAWSGVVVAACQKRPDIFRIFSVPCSVACGGGIIHDVCIAAISPAG